MNIGRMRELVTVWAPSSSASSDGDYGYPTWASVATLWADVRPLSARERAAARTVSAETTYSVSVRYRDDLTSKCKLVCAGPDYAGSTMQIHGIIKDHRMGVITMDCSEAKA